MQLSTFNTVDYPMTPHPSHASPLAVLWLTACVARMRSKYASRSRPPDRSCKKRAAGKCRSPRRTERAFYEKVQRVTAYRSLRGLDIPPEVIADLGRSRLDKAVAALSVIASQGDNEANIALVHIQHWCNAVSPRRAGDPKTQIAKLVQGQPDARAARVAGVVYAELEYIKRAAPMVRQGSLRLLGHRGASTLGCRCWRPGEALRSSRIPALDPPARSDAADRGQEERQRSTR